MISESRYDRSERFFGKEGQQRLRETSVVVIGVGGLGSPLVQHLALLGVKRISFSDHQDLDESNRNRFVGARASDPIPGTTKAKIIDRLIRETNPDVDSNPIPKTLVSEEAFNAVRCADWVFGCLDHDGPRSILNELCSAYNKPYIDLASDVPASGGFGGHVAVLTGGNGCLRCRDLLDQEAIDEYINSPEEHQRKRAIYGVGPELLGERGPSVSPLNGLIASLGAVEFMAAVSGLREPTSLQKYYGDIPRLTSNKDAPAKSCYNCSMRGRENAANVERYLNIPHLRER